MLHHTQQPRGSCRAPVAPCGWKGCPQRRHRRAVGRDQNTGDIDLKSVAIDGAVQDERCHEAARAQPRPEGRGLPASMRHAEPQALAASGPPVAPCHVGRGPSLGDERIQNRTLLNQVGHVCGSPDRVSRILAELLSPTRLLPLPACRAFGIPLAGRVLLQG